MRKLLFFALLLLPLMARADTCPTAANYWNVAETAQVSLSTLGIIAGQCFYVAASGNDANPGTKASPWAHIPGMVGSTVSHVPVPGDAYLLKGGDTWTGSNFPIDWIWTGTSANPIYVGVDSTFFTGGSWTRPIFNFGGTKGGTVLTIDTNSSHVPSAFVTFDNFELTGWHETGPSAPLVQTFSHDTIVENWYAHNWSRDTTLPVCPTGTPACVDNANNAFFSANTGFNITGTQARRNYIDGSDTARNMMAGIHGVDIASNNYIAYVVVGVGFSDNTIRGNRIDNIVTTWVPNGDHCDGIFNHGQISGNVTMEYNNVVSNLSCPGGIMLWDATLSSLNACSGCTHYVFNNIVYGDATADGPVIQLGYHPSSGNTGTYFVYNNTVDTNGGAGGFCIGNGEASTPTRSTTHFGNNHCIAASGGICNGAGTTCTDDGGNLPQTAAQATANVTPKFDNYRDSTVPYALAPLASTNSTVNAGANFTSLCGSVPIPALCSDTTYLLPNTSNHTVSTRTVVAHPASGAWDIGAFEFNGVAPPPTVSLTPNPLAFGNQNINTTSSTQIVTLQNTGGSNLVVSNVTVSSVFTNTGTGSCTGTSFTLAPGALCTFKITFTPTATIAYTGCPTSCLSVTDNASGSPHTVSLTGQGTQATITWTPSTYNFGSQFTGTSTNSTNLHLSNTGTGPLNLSLSLGGVNPGMYAIFSNTCVNPIAAGTGCDVVIRFSPTSVGSLTAVLTETDSLASNSPQSVTLSGTGVAPIINIPAPVIPILLGGN